MSAQLGLQITENFLVQGAHIVALQVFLLHHRVFLVLLEATALKAQPIILQLVLFHVLLAHITHLQMLRLLLTAFLVQQATLAPHRDSHRSLSSVVKVTIVLMELFPQRNFLAHQGRILDFTI